MFADPQVVTVNAVAKSMPRISSDGRKATYQMNDQSYTMTISHVQNNKDRVRSMVRIDNRAIVSDPLTAVNDFETLSVYLVFDRPLAGFTVVQVQQLITGFKTWLSDTAVSQVYGQES